MFDQVVEVAERLGAVVAALDPDRVPDGDAERLWAALDRVERLAAAGKTLLARRLAQAHRPERAGAGSCAEALARRGGTTVGAARDTLDTSTRLPGQPTVAAALRRGDLSPTQAALVTAAAAADPAAEARLVELAGRASLPELRQECGRVRAAADPDPQATNARLHAARRLRRFTDPDGGWNLVARGTPQAGAAFNAVLDPITDQIFHTARREGRREPAEAYAFDALLELAARAAGRATAAASAAPDLAAPRTAPDGTAHPATDPTPEDEGHAAPTESAAAAAPDEPAVPEPAVPEPIVPDAGLPDAVPGAVLPRRAGWANPQFLALLRIDVTALHRGRVAGDELCEIAGVGPIPVPVARGLLGDAVLKLVITRGVDVANVTHLGRGPTAAQKIALAWTSPGCTVQGCYRSRIEYDHRADYARTRHTRLDELDPLCRVHHDLKTRHNWALVPGTGKRPMVPPDDPRHPRHQHPPRQHPRHQRPSHQGQQPSGARSWSARPGRGTDRPRPAGGCSGNARSPSRRQSRRRWAT